VKLVDLSSTPPLHAALPAAPRPPADRKRHAPIERWVRWAAAEWWLNTLFFASRRFPGFVLWGKPFFVWGSWKHSHYLQDNILVNARRLLGDGSTAGQRWQLGRSVVSNFFDFIVDIGRSVGQSQAQLLTRIASVEGDQTYKAARAARQGAIVLTAHMGSFEVGIAALLQHERRVRVLFRRDAFGLFERTRSKLRRQLGVIEECVDDGLETWMRLREALAADEVVLIQGDRVMPGQKGRRMPVLGGHMVLPTGPLKLAMATGAPIVPTFSVRDPDGRIRLFIEPPIWVEDEASFESGLEAVRAALEKYLRRFPDQWLMIHRAWCEDADEPAA
jgi:phosphatidylinositol dimannoside acyltransferase